MLPTSVHPAARSSSPWTELTPPLGCPRYLQPYRPTGTPGVPCGWQASPPACNPPLLTPSHHQPAALLPKSPGCSSPPPGVVPPSRLGAGPPAAMLCAYCSWEAFKMQICSPHATAHPSLALNIPALSGCFYITGTTLVHSTLLSAPSPALAPAPAVPSAQHLSLPHAINPPFRAPA